LLGSLDDDDGEKFDQFKGKRSTYREEFYTTKIDQTKITKDIDEIA
jgi:hypothetical protein